MLKEEWYEKESIIFKEFKNQLSKVKTFPEAQLLIRKAPPENTPGRKYYTRFALFIDGFYTIPSNLSDEERSLYLDFIEMLDKTEQLKPGVGKEVKKKLNFNK